MEELVKNDTVFYRNMKNQAKKTKATDEKYKDLGRKRAEEAKKRASQEQEADLQGLYGTWTRLDFKS